MLQLSNVWVTGDGGPLIFMEQGLLPHWEGSDAPSQGHVVDASSRWGLAGATDYDRACDIDNWSGVIAVGDGEAFVMSVEGNATTWLPALGTSVGTLVEWGYADSEHVLIRAAEDCIEDAEAVVETDFNIKSCPLVLFVAAESGREPLYERLKAEIGPGIYKIKTQVKVTATTSVICHRFDLQQRVL